MGIENVQQLLSEQLGKGTLTIFNSEDGAQSGDFYAVYLPVTSVISAITVDSATGEDKLQTTMPAGTTLIMNIKALTLSSGIGILYHE
jgi:hypothetical protein